VYKTIITAISCN